ncbi:SART-1 protein [Penicillium expansum]|uniref:SART-1 protein n=1 Tax=Penicillium expansum TaxID=27334 RepID=A0A0A2JJM9_PENEN|nr:SART-1 protein [Penicillium expansum]KGO43804.1 SART-1 protein [Penicillium expansum]KGO51970.1 SART-1 protein [Penicillium expansum]KGO55026.1 SART-1 protein [Penicillium expansum]
MADALSIEQNNKIRVALGLKPLPVPGAGPEFREDDDSESGEEEDPASTLESRQAESYDNWKKIQDTAEAKRKRDEKNAAIKRARDIAQRNLQLQGSTLGEGNGDELDTKAWLSQSKKRQKKIEKERAQRLAEELAERERLAETEYTAADLAGIKVGHAAGAFDGGEDHILTLKDAAVDDEEEDDELQNLDLVEKERTEEKLELKKKKPVYDPTAENQGILSQYDEEIEGKKRKRFTLDAQGSTEEREAKRQEVSNQLRKNIISLDFEPEVPSSDYMDISEVKIKKPKKKKAKATKKRTFMDDDEIAPAADSTDAQGSSAMDIDSNGGVPVAPRKPVNENVSFVDDDDLQASLALQRRAAFKKRKKISPEELAKQLREEETQTPMDIENSDNEGEEPGLVIDETSEFVSNLHKPTLLEQEEKHATAAAKEPESPSAEPEGEGVEIDMDRYGDIEDEEELAARIKRDEASAAQPQQLTGTGLEEESTLDQGLAATLSMLKSRGLVKDNDSTSQNTLMRDRQRFLADKANRESETERRARQQRERDRASGKLERMSAREREEHARWENKQRDQQEARHMADVFNREYKPDVQLRYVDEFGRNMNQKEAFKQLSHQFHGKGSGKMKTEKRLKKIDEEKKRESMSTLDSSQNTGMNAAVGTAARKNRQAGVRLG